MREILFRGKSVVQGEWVCGNLLMTHGEPYIAPLTSDIGDVHGWRVDPETVDQCTGKNDKDGTWIFEGDIMKFELFPGASCIGVVKWSEKDCAFFTQISKRNGTGVYSSGKIIGNIHDNPELMEDRL